MPSNNYRYIAGPMCSNCRKFYRESCPLFTGKDDSGKLLGAVCDEHEFNEGTLDTFNRLHKGALPVTVMIPKPNNDGKCSGNCIFHDKKPLFDYFPDDDDILISSCDRGWQKNGKPSKGCPQYGGE